MSETLFGDDGCGSNVDRAAARGNAEVLPTWQVEGLRASLDRAGVSEQRERRAVVEAIVKRSVAALRDLTPAEAGRVRDELARRAKPDRAPAVSTWDERDRDTWIDRM